MNRTQQIAAGVALFGAGIVVAILGYLGVSKETDVAFQLPYFASAGVGALLLFVGGATMIGRSQLSADAHRLGDIEEAVRLLAAEVGRLTDERDVLAREVEDLKVVETPDEIATPHKPRTRAPRPARR